MTAPYRDAARRPVLRDYQEDLYRRGVRAMRNGQRRMLFVGATGCGKTTVACRIMESVVGQGGRCLFLAHRRELVRQCFERLDEFGLHLGVQMRDHPRADETAPIQVGSVQTLARRGGERYDVVVVDEAHRTLGASYLRVLKAANASSVCGLTATPCRTDGRGLGHVYDGLTATVGARELIRRGHLYNC